MIASLWEEPIVRPSALIKELTKRRDAAQRVVDGYDAALNSLDGAIGGRPGRKPRTMPASARKRIGAAQRKRWAEVKRQQRSKEKKT